MVTLLEMARLASAAYSERECVGRFELTRAFRGRGGFAASLWREGTGGLAVLSVRGTRGLADCVQDLRLLFGREPRAWRAGRGALDLAREELGAACRLYLTGHSIGGAYASALGAEAGLRTVTFNAPGMRAVLRRAGCLAQSPEGPTACVLNVCSLEDFIWRLSGPGVGASVVLPVACATPAPDRTGPMGVVSAWRRERRRRPGLRPFVRRALRLHGMRALDEHARGARGRELWSRTVEELFRDTTLRERALDPSNAGSAHSAPTHPSAGETQAVLVECQGDPIS